MIGAFEPLIQRPITMARSVLSDCHVAYPYKNGLHPVFQMNLPEGRLRESIERTFRKRAQGFDQLALLEVVGRSQIGRLRFSNDPGTIDQVPLQSVHELIPSPALVPKPQAVGYAGEGLGEREK